MVDSNPYVAPAAIEDESVILASAGRGASLIWLAGSVAMISLAAATVWMNRVYGYGDVTTAFMMALLSAAAITIPAVAIYASVRYLSRRRLVYTSTPFSLMVAGTLLASVMLPIYFVGSMSSELVAWGISVVAALIVCYGLCKIEGWIARKYPQHNAFRSQVENGAGVFWFSAGCLVFGFVVGAVVQTPDLMSIVAGGVITAALLCLLGTASYAIATSTLPRTHPATIGSRLSASLAFCLAVYLFGIGMDLYNVPPGVTRLIILLPTSVLAVLADRTVSRLQSHDNTGKLRSDQT